ncbi:MAG: hypothetical protein EZS28_016265, partial [Streblomastix strix]
KFMKYYGGGIKNMEQSRKECESRINGMWMSNSLPLEMVFLVYDKEKQADEQGRREASLYVGVDTNGSEGGIVTAGLRDKQGNMEENPDLFCISLEKDSSLHQNKIRISLLLKLFEILHEKEIYEFDGISATVHPDNNPGEQILKHAGFEFRCQENRSYLIADCKLRNVYDYKFDRYPKIPVITRAECGDSTSSIQNQMSFLPEHSKSISEPSSE